MTDNGAMSFTESAEVPKEGSEPIQLTEIWKDIPGYEGYYQASNLGRLKRLPTTAKHTNKIGGILKQTNSLGYYKVSLCANGVRKSHRVNILIAKTFIPNLHNKPQVNHMDHVKTNNRVDNLEWVTASENKIHTINAGRVKTTRCDFKVDAEKAIKIREIRSTGMSQPKIARLLNLSQPTISLVINRVGRYRNI